MAREMMTGQRSPALLLRLTEHLQRLLPNAERVDIAGASHAMQEENPGTVNEAILDFLARHASQRNVHSHQRPSPTLE
jgi:pimeloyl-ACP methyl ester carboxylesterase